MRGSMSMRHMTHMRGRRHAPSPYLSREGRGDIGGEAA